MKTNTEILKARMEGATAALEGRKLDANTYEETDDLHFEWLAGWTSARMEMQKRRGQREAVVLHRLVRQNADGNT